MDTFMNLFLHLLVFGTLLVTQVYQNFVNFKIWRKPLPMHQFIALQKAILPFYFTRQFFLATLAVISHPPILSTHSVPSFTTEPLVAVSVCGLLNGHVFGPRTLSGAIAAARAIDVVRGISKGTWSGLASDFRASPVKDVILVDLGTDLIGSKLNRRLKD